MVWMMNGLGACGGSFLGGILGLLYFVVAVFIVASIFWWTKTLFDGKRKR